MNDLKNGVENSELLRIIKGSLADARDSVQKLAHLFIDNVRQLRMQESEEVFNQLAQNIVNLQYFMEFIGELRTGMRYFGDFGLPLDPITYMDSGIKLFREMHAAIEKKDWIMLSDLIEYELSPLLMKEDEWMNLLEEKVKIFEV